MYGVSVVWEGVVSVVWEGVSVMVSVVCVYGVVLCGRV